MTSIKNYLKLFVFVVIALVFLPRDVLAENITVKVKTNPSSNDSLLEIIAEKDVTTVAQLKQELEAQNINLDDYVVLNGWYSIANDNEVVCLNSSLYCSGPIGNLFTNLYLMQIDHTEKKYTLNSIPAVDENMAYSLFETNYELFEPLSYRSCNSTFDVCTFIDHQNFVAYDNVVIKYNYDKGIAALAQKVIDAGKLENTEFTATDTELLHYFNYGGSIVNYTSSFKNQLSNLNFTFEMDQRGGAFEPFETDAIGFYKFLYNGTVYAVKDFMSVTAPHIVYVPTDSENVKTALENRLKEMFGKELHLTVTESDETINELLASCNMDTIAGGDNKYYILTVNGTNDYREGFEYFVIVKKDSSKINNNISFKSSDLVTKVSVEADGDVPLDTVVNVKEITSGDEYDKIIKVLNVSDAEMFDIKLHSTAQKRNVTELPNGKFLVSIPIPEKYEGKTLVVYYVDQDNKVTPYTVKAENGYATFETDHFSIYTLTVDTNAATNTIANPATGDNIKIYIGLFGLSILGIIVVCIFIKKKLR